MILLLLSLVRCLKIYIPEGGIIRSIVRSMSLLSCLLTIVAGTKLLPIHITTKMEGFGLRKISLLILEPLKEITIDGTQVEELQAAKTPRIKQELKPNMLRTLFQDEYQRS